MLSNCHQRIIASNTYKLLWEYSFQTALSNCYQRNQHKQFFHTMLSNYYQKIPNCIHSHKFFLEKSFQTVISNYYQKNHCRELRLSIIRQIISNCACNPLLKNSILSKQCFLKSVVRKLLQAVLTCYYKWFISNNFTTYYKHSHKKQIVWKHGPS